MQEPEQALVSELALEPVRVPALELVPERARVPGLAPAQALELE